ncbi:hypothetical protein Tco_1102123 [Tanacetum coccineum]
MAAPGGNNQVARRVIDDRIEFSGETSVNGLVTNAEEEVEAKEAQIRSRGDVLGAYVTDGCSAKGEDQAFSGMISNLCIALRERFITRTSMKLQMLMTSSVVYDFKSALQHDSSL